ncbi:MAG TPA: hypothetical protein VGR16_15160 [Thermomicrobiales bacterium]|nr:hypothetical protein [Thermomicrobiales bacterium]
MVEPPSRTRGPERSLVLIAGLTGLVVIVTIVLAFTLGDREPATFDPGTPERAVQDYLQALDDGDVEAAYALLASEYRRTTSLATFTNSGGQKYGYRQDADRVTVEDVDIDGETARLQLGLRFVADDGDDYEQEIDVALVRESGAWRLRNPLPL